MSLRRQLVALTALGAPLGVPGCDAKGDADTGEEWCGYVPEAEVGGAPEDRARYCFDPPTLDGNTCPSAERARAFANELLTPYLGEPHENCTWYGEITCGPDVSADGRCCFVVEEPSDNSCAVIGRPFIVQGRQRRAPVDGDPAWSARSPLVIPEVPQGARARLAALWSRAARAEHASVAAFARSSLRLMGLGAPPELLAETARAMADEVEHARICFQVASALAGRPVGPRALDVTDALDGPGGLDTVLVETIREGCIGESLSAAEARVAATDAHPEIGAILRRIADDETRHAALAWRAARWILSSDPALTELARRAFTAPALPHGRDPLPAPVLARYGLLSAARGSEVRAATLGAVVGPLADALLERSERRAPVAPHA